MSNLNKHLKSIITWVLLGLVVWVWVQFILFPKHRTTNLQASTTPPTQLSDSTTRPQLSSYHLFGSSTESQIPLNLLQAETSLDLIITGIIASDDPNQGLAYIRNRQGDEKKFKVGDSVFDLADIESIHADHLVLSRSGGKQEKLSLSKGYESQSNGIKTTRVANQKAEQNAREVNAQRIASHIKKPADWQAVLDKQKYDPNKIANIVNNISVVKDSQGQIAGLRVSQLSGSSALVKQGLRANDQIVSVNGIDISYKNILTLQQQLQGSENVAVTIMRNGRRMNLNLNLSEFQ